MSINASTGLVAVTSTASNGASVATVAAADQYGHVALQTDCHQRFVPVEDLRSGPQ